MKVPELSKSSLVKAIVVITLSILLLGILDLYTLQLVMHDPGYYVVARRSDTPSQVLNALEILQREKFRNTKKIRSLIRRYNRKIRNNKSEKTPQWKTARQKALQLLAEVHRGSNHDTTSAR